MCCSGSLKQESIKQLLKTKKFKQRYRFNEPLWWHTTFQIGGEADIWFEPRNLDELKEIVDICHQKKIKFIVIGAGSNILFSDKGFRGIVICLDSPYFTKMEFRGNSVSVGAGLSLSRLVRNAQQRGLGGLEFLAGVPASLGGALVMNAACNSHSIASFVKRVTLMDGRGKIKVLRKRDLKFGYRRSNLAGYIVIEIVLRLVKRSKKKIKENIVKFLREKKRTQDLSSKSAGCIFKNPRHRLTAGEMIEACGLKNRRQAGAQISAKHANYIINRQGARAADVLYLMRLAQREVKKRFAVHLEPEIRIIR